MQAQIVIYCTLSRSLYVVIYKDLYVHLMTNMLQRKQYKMYTELYKHLPMSSTN